MSKCDKYHKHYLPASGICEPCWEVESDNAFASCASSISCCEWSMAESERFSRAHAGKSDSARNGVSVRVVPIIRTFLVRSMMHYN